MNLSEEPGYYCKSSLTNALLVYKPVLTTVPNGRNHPMESETDVRLIACVELMNHKGMLLIRGDIQKC